MLKSILKSWMIIYCLCNVQLSYTQINNQSALKSSNLEIEDIKDFQLEACNADWPAFLTTKWSSNCPESDNIDSDAGVPDGESEDGCIQYRLYTFKVIDNCGNSAEETTRVSREYDITNPEIEDLDDFMLESCNADWPAYLKTKWTDNCTAGGQVDSDAGVADGESEDGCTQYRLYTFTVTDNCGNSDEETTRVGREYDMTDPEIVDLEDFQLEGCNAEWPAFLSTTWTDNCADGGEVESDAGVPDGESEDGCSQYRLYTFEVTDNCGNSDKKTTRVEREYDMTDPEIVDLEDYQLEGCNAEWPEYLKTNWTDNCTSGGEVESDSGVPDGESEDGCIQYRLFTFSVTDNCGNSDEETTRVGREYDMIDPEIVDLEDFQLVGCNADWPTFLTTTWTDNCADGGEVESDTGVPDGESEDGCIQYRLYTFEVTDNCGNSDKDTTRVSRYYDVIDPEIADIEDFQLEGCNADWPANLTTTWTDNCAESGKVESDAGVPDGESQDGCIQYRLYTFTVTDNCGNSDEETTRVGREYDIIDPEIGDLEDYILDGCNTDWPEFLTTSWMDNCTDGGELNSDIGVPDGESEDGCIQYRLYTFTVTDDCGNSDEETTRVGREFDMTDPAIVDLEDYILNGCNAEWPEFLTTSYTDNCTDEGEVDSDAGAPDGESEDGCIQYRLYTFTVTDDCGNSDEATTRVGREYDMTNPEIVDLEDYVLEGCNTDWPEFLTTSYTDNCTDEGMVDSDAGAPDGESEDGCIQYRLYTFTVTDDCGNSDEETTRVGRENDMTAPEIDDLEDYQLEGCNTEWPEFLTTSWTDNCSDGGELMSDAGVFDGESEDGNIEYRLYTFEISDNCLNSDTEETRVSKLVSSTESGNFEEFCGNAFPGPPAIPYDLNRLLPDGTDPNGSWSAHPDNQVGVPISADGTIVTIDLPEGDYLFWYTIEDENECDRVIEVRVGIFDPEEEPCVRGTCDPDPATALTPNGDGVNDTFFGGFDDAERALGCKMHVQIFNRWGAKIFEKRDYKNDWDGSVQSNAVGSSDSITTGTYFYIIIITSISESEFEGNTLTGYFYAATD